MTPATYVPSKSLGLLMMQGGRTKTTTTVVWSLATAVLLLLAAAHAEGKDPAPYQPIVYPAHNTNFLVGHNFTLLCKTLKRENTSFTWITPDKEKVPLLETQFQNVSGDVYQTSRMTVRNATLEDSGQYICNVWEGGLVKNSYPYEVEVRETVESYVRIEPVTTDITVDEGQDVSWAVSVAAFPPEPVLVFRGPSGEEVETSDKVRTEFLPGKVEATLHLLKVSRSSVGSYTIEAQTRDGNASAGATLRLRIRHAPLVRLPSVAIIPENGTKRVECRVEGYPLPRIIWEFQSCPSVEESCEKNFEEVEVMSINVSEKEVVAWKDWGEKLPGILKCEAKNFLGTEVAKTRIVVSDIDDGYVFRLIDNMNQSNVIAEEEEIEVTEGDLIKLECAAVKSVYSEVTLDAPNATSLHFTNSNTSLSWLLTSETKGVSLDDEGFYACHGSVNKGLVPKGVNKTSELHLIVIPQMIPYIVEGTDALPETHTVVVEENTERYTIHCRVKGSPLPRIVWKKNGLPFTAAGESGLTIRKGGHEVLFSSVGLEDAGLYECQAENRAGVVTASVTIKVIQPINQTGNSGTLKDTFTLFLQENTKNYEIYCHVDASPPPQINWTKDGLPFNSSSKDGPRVSEDELRILFPLVTAAVAGRYECQAVDHPGEVIDTFIIKIVSGHNWSYRLCGIFIIVVLLFLFVVSMFSQYCQEKGMCGRVLDGSNPYSVMSETNYRRSTQRAGNSS